MKKKKKHCHVSHIHHLPFDSRNRNKKTSRRKGRAADPHVRSLPSALYSILPQNPTLPTLFHATAVLSLAHKRKITPRSIPCHTTGTRAKDKKSWHGTHPFFSRGLYHHPSIHQSILPAFSGEFFFSLALGLGLGIRANYIPYWRLCPRLYRYLGIVWDGLSEVVHDFGVFGI